jgi:hypothetical protein
MKTEKLEIKPLPTHDFESALGLAERCRASEEPEAAESACLDVLAIDPENERALELLILARTDLLERGLPGGVEKAREVLERLDRPYERAYYGALICERQARYLLRQRGARAGAIAYDWLRQATDRYEDAMRMDPERAEPVVRYNACVRLIERHPHCAAGAEDEFEIGLE